MTTPAELAALAERAEAASGPDADLDWDIAEALGFPRPLSASYSSSLDAAMTLAGGCDWYVTSIRSDPGKFAGALFRGKSPIIDYAEAATPALALTAATLRARASLTR
jgi:hypothetical protein